MKSRNVLLLTQDVELRNGLSDALREDGAIVQVTHTVSDALQALCRRGRELGLVVIDFDHGCHGMTLLRAIRMCRENLAIVVVTSSDLYHAAAVAYANGADACLAKPVTVAELRIVVEELDVPKLMLTESLTR